MNFDTVIITQKKLRETEENLIMHTFVNAKKKHNLFQDLLIRHKQEGNSAKSLLTASKHFEPIMTPLLKKSRGNLLN